MCLQHKLLVPIVQKEENRAEQSPGAQRVGYMWGDELNGSNCEKEKSEWDWRTL